MFAGPSGLGQCGRAAQFPKVQTEQTVLRFVGKVFENGKTVSGRKRFVLVSISDETLLGWDND